MKRVSREKLCVLAGVAAAVCGLVGVLFVPHFAHRTYISDNSLLPGVASVQFGRADMEYASRVTRAYIHCHNASERHALVLEKMAEIGLETYSVDETLVWGILRAPSAEGKESVALATHTTADTLAPDTFDSLARDQQRAGTPLSDGLGVTLAIARHLSQANWLAKDFVFVVSMRAGGIEEWIDNYVTREPRAGAIQTALVLDLPPVPSAAFIDGFDGQLPNLDMVNSFLIIADNMAGSKTVSMSAGGFPENELTRFVANTAVPEAEKLVVKHWFRNKKHLFRGYCNQLADLVRFIWLQARGVPNGDHAFFTRYRIDSITIGMTNVSYRMEAASPYRVKQFMVASSTVSLLRSLNNLLTHMHRSFYIYLLSGPLHYTSVAEYSVIIALLVGAVLLFGCSRIRATGDYAVSDVLVAVAELLWFNVVSCSLYVCSKLMLVPGGFGVESFAAVCAVASVLAVIIPVCIQNKYPVKSRSAFADVLTAVALLPCVIYLGTTYLNNFSFCALASAALVLPAALHSLLPYTWRFVRGLCALLCSVPVLVGLVAHITNTSWETLVLNAFEENQRFDSPLASFVLLFYLPFSHISFRLSLLPKHSCACPASQDKQKQE